MNNLYQISNMKTRINRLTAFILLILLSAACAKDNQTSLQLTIVNPGNSHVSNASVTLYKSLSDFQNGTNTQDVQISDNNGSVTFQNLGANVYYFNVYRGQDCSTNLLTTTKSATLTSGKVNTQTVIVNQIGEETFKNTSTDQYSVIIDSSAFQIMSGGASASADLIVGAHTIHIKPVSTGTAKNYPITVTSCQTQTLSFP
jgi:hypothetical protein